MPEENKKINYVWVHCPSCEGRLFRHVQPKKFDIEAPCKRCRAIYRIHSEGEGVSFDLVQEPKKVGGYYPRETK
jgi:hypothetical protein